MDQRPESQSPAAVQALRQMRKQPSRITVVSGSATHIPKLGLCARSFGEFLVAKLKSLAALSLTGTSGLVVGMPEQIEEYREELPVASAPLMITGALVEALVATIAHEHGRRAAVRFLTMLEENLEDLETTDKVALIRGERAREDVRRYRRAGLNWVRRMSPVFVRRVGS